MPPSPSNRETRPSPQQEYLQQSQQKHPPQSSIREHSYFDDNNNNNNSKNNNNYYNNEKESTNNYSNRNNNNTMKQHQRQLLLYKQQIQQETKYDQSQQQEHQQQEEEGRSSPTAATSSSMEDETESDSSTGGRQQQHQQQQGRSLSSSQQQQQADHNDASVKEYRRRQYSLSELVSCLNNQQDHLHHQNNNNIESITTSLPPELYRRVMDYRLAQQKRFQKYGATQKWGIYGVYLHLANVRTDLEWAEDAAWRRQEGQPYLSWSDFETAQKRRHQRQVYYVTYTLLSLCTLFLVIAFAVNSWTIEPLHVNPLIGPSAETLIHIGALDTNKIVEQGQWFRLFTPLILHAGIIHYIINMGAIWFFGGAIEQSHGGFIAALLFLVPAVGGNLLSAIFLPQYISVGASGGIFGWIGACLADIIMHWNLLFLKDCSEQQQQHHQQQSHPSTTTTTAMHSFLASLSSFSTTTWWPRHNNNNNNNNNNRQTSSRQRNFWALFWIVVEVAVNIVMGLTPYIDNFIHLGGFVYGILCGWTVIQYGALNFLGYQAGLWTKLRMISLRFLGMLTSVLFIIITTAWLATMEVGDNPCVGCRYFNCIPFPPASNDPWWYCDDCFVVSANLFRQETRTSNVVALRQKNNNTTSNNNTITETPPVSSYYSRIDLTCPDGEIVQGINVTLHQIATKDEMVHRLPDYCRDYCDNVYVS